MGTLRFILACVVLLSHLGIRIGGLNPGVVAVVIFYCLAGHVVASLWLQWQEQANPIMQFYRDRFWRIMPQYLIALIWAIVLWRNQVDSSFLSRPPGTWDWLANLLIIPLNYYMYTGQDHFTLIPPAWSLGAEIQFYLLAPLLLAQPLTRITLSLAISLIVFVLAKLQILDTEIYGYRLLPGVLFIFLIGVLQQITINLPILTTSLKKQKINILLITIWLANALYLLWSFLFQQNQFYNQEVGIGLLLAQPLLIMLCKINKKTQLHRIDRSLGQLSYGIFLYHFPVMWMLNTSPAAISNTEVLANLLVTTLSAVIGHWLIEKPLWRVVR